MKNSVVFLLVFVLLLENYRFGFGGGKTKRAEKEKDGMTAKTKFLIFSSIQILEVLHYRYYKIVRNLITFKRFLLNCIEDGFSGKFSLFIY